MYSQSALVSTPVVAEEFETFATYDKQSEFSHNLHSNIVDEFHFLFEPDHMTCPVSSVFFSCHTVVISLQWGIYFLM